MAPVISAYGKELVALGYTEAEVNAYLAFIKERIGYWARKEKEKNIPKAY